MAPVVWQLETLPAPQGMPMEDRESESADLPHSSSQAAMESAHVLLRIAFLFHFSMLTLNFIRAGSNLLSMCDPRPHHRLCVKAHTYNLVGPKHQLFKRASLTRLWRLHVIRTCQGAGAKSAASRRDEAGHTAALKMRDTFHQKRTGNTTSWGSPEACGLHMWCLAGMRRLHACLSVLDVCLQCGCALALPPASPLHNTLQNRKYPSLNVLNLACLQSAPAIGQ